MNDHVVSFDFGLQTVPIRHVGLDQPEAGAAHHVHEGTDAEREAIVDGDLKNDFVSFDGLCPVGWLQIYALLLILIDGVKISYFNRPES